MKTSRRRMEKAIRRPLTKEEVVHHKDENPNNNKLSNLVLLPSRAAHKAEHVRLEAVKACGNSSFRKCYVCKMYDDPKNLLHYKGYVHPVCNILRIREWALRNPNRKKKPSKKPQRIKRKLLPMECVNLLDSLLSKYGG